MNNNFLIICDLSYWTYFVLFGSVSDFQKNYPDEAALWIKPLSECDQENLPNLLNCNTFTKILRKYVMKRLETIDYIAKQNFQNELDAADKIDVIMAMDDNLSHNFRLKMYPQYKQQRKLDKKQYQVYPIKDYIINVIFKELDLENQYGYHLIKVEGAEGDDVIATILMNFKDQYQSIMLVASDHDYLQIDGIKQYDLFGKEITRTLGDEEVSSSDFLLGKILMGDKSDNIQQVFTKCGPKTALKLVKDKDLLKKMLQENQSAAAQFKINKKIISFNEIPEELSQKIIEKVNVEIYDRRALNSKINLNDFMML